MTEVSTNGAGLAVPDPELVEGPSYTQKLWMRLKRKAAYLPG